MMKNYCIIGVMAIVSAALYSCGKKQTDKDRAIALVEAENNNQKLDFDEAKLDSLYNIMPEAYADSLKKGSELDTALAGLESEIEHLSQEESDSVGLISATLTKERYRLLDLVKTKPAFIGWKLSGVVLEEKKVDTLSFNFDKGITKIVP